MPPIPSRANATYGIAKCRTIHRAATIVTISMTGFETTLSGRSYLNLIRHLKGQRYEAHFLYLRVPNVDLALSRIRGRVSLGGHDVPAADVRRRFDRSIRNFLVHYRPLADSWTLYDNTGTMPRIIASEQGGKLQIIETTLCNDLIGRYGKL
jgi:predicted ABC-type ATPase